jgi:hypothetical protein
MAQWEKGFLFIRHYLYDKEQSPQEIIIIHSHLNNVPPPLLDLS